MNSSLSSPPSPPFPSPPFLSPSHPSPPFSSPPPPPFPSLPLSLPWSLKMWRLGGVCSDHFQPDNFKLTRTGKLNSAKTFREFVVSMYKWANLRYHHYNITSSASCFGSSACLQSSSSVLRKTSHGPEPPQDRSGGTHAEGAGHPDKLTAHGQRWYHAGGTHCWLPRRRPAQVATVDRSVTSAPHLTWWTNRKSYMVYRTAPLSMTLTDPKLRF